MIKLAAYWKNNNEESNVITTYEGLHQTVKAGLEAFLAGRPDCHIGFEIADNGACAMTNSDNGNKLSFMLAKFGDEFKVGFAFFEKGEAQPDWFDDAYNTEFDQQFVLNLIKEQLMVDPVF